MTKPLALGVTVLLAILGVVFAIGAPFLLGVHATLAGLQAASPRLIVMLAASAIASAAAKAGKQQLMQTALGLRIRFRRTLAITFVTDAAFLGSPFGAAGYGVNLGLLQRSGASWTQATTVVSGDQALDLAFFTVAVPVSFVSCIGLIAGLITPKSLHIVAGASIGAIALACAVWTYRRKLAESAGGAIRRVGMPTRPPARWTAFIANVRDEWRHLLSGSRWRLGALLLLTTTQWLLRYGALWFILLEQGYALPPGFVVAVQALVLHAALWTGIPAGGGGGDLGLAAAFGAWVPHAAVGAALILWRFATLFCPLVLGAVGMLALALARVNRRS
ncbi:flippase-like domain-containing protein [Paraburkholderia bryophila]|uniref:flippase-like domain-containing protein n=1 Tax=Paraburkholderia bryophila TaxID=420952 RepID=UPI0023496601|nr:flippase-like domain-containing protein [Paraburkholderia bryophila]WCM23722.1 flippase-like domain-containing protein [Paraburkholderia bryophila]